MSILRATRLNLLHWFNDPKYPAVLVYIVTNMAYLIGSISIYATELDTYIHPWLFPFMMRGFNVILPLMLGFVLLIADAPFQDRQQRLILLRIGKQIWIAGQILYLFILSVAFVVLIYLLSLLCCLPRLRFSAQWGNFLTTIAINGLPGKYGVLSCSYAVMRNASPLEVTLWSAVSLTLVCFLLGLTMLVCNLWLGKGIGNSLISATIVMPLITEIFRNSPYLYRYLTWITPMNWPDRSIMGQTGQNLPSYAYGIYMPLLLSLILTIVAISTIHRCNLDTDKE